MRLTLKIDVEVADETIPRLAEMQSDQPICYVSIGEAGSVAQVFNGRFMGAQVTFGD